MGFNPKWEEFWDYYKSVSPEQQASMKIELQKEIDNASPDIKKEMLKSAPIEFHIIKSGPGFVPDRQAAWDRLFGDKPLAIQSASKLRKHGRMGQENRYNMRRMLYFLGRGLFGR